MKTFRFHFGLCFLVLTSLAAAAMSQTTQPDAPDDHDPTAISVEPAAEGDDDAMMENQAEEPDADLPPPPDALRSRQRGSLFDDAPAEREAAPQRRVTTGTTLGDQAAPADSSAAAAPKKMPATQPSAASATTAADASDESATPESASESASEPAGESADEPATSAETAGTTTQPARVIPEPQPWSYYRPLVERNMFTRTQATTRRPSNRDEQASSQPTTTQPAQPRSSWILTGVVLHAGGRVAFFENSASGMTMRVAVGQEIGSFTLQEVAEDHVRLESLEKQASRVYVGQSLDGSSATLSASPRNSIFGDGGSDGDDSSASDGDRGRGSGNRAESGEGSGMSVAERMRARRRQQMNQ